MSKPLGPYTPVVHAGDFVIVSGQGGIRDGVKVAGGVRAEYHPDDAERRRSACDRRPRP